MYTSGTTLDVGQIVVYSGAEPICVCYDSMCVACVPRGSSMREVWEVSVCRSPQCPSSGPMRGDPPPALEMVVDTEGQLAKETNDVGKSHW